MDLITRDEPVVLITPQFKTTAVLNQKITMINRQKVDTTPAIGMPFDSVFEMQKTSGSSNRPVFKLVLLPGERNLMKSDERDVQAAGDYDNRNLKDDGSSQALDYEEIERLKAGGLRDQAMVDHLVAHSKTFEEKTDFSKAKYLKKKQAKYCCRVKICRPNIQLMWDQFSNNVGNLKDNKICQLRLDTISQIVNQADVQFGSRLLLVENCMGLVAAAMLERLGGSGSLVHIHNYQSNHSVISKTHRGEIRIPIIPAVCSPKLRKTLIDLPLAELTWMLADEHSWPSRLIEWADSHPSSDLHSLLDNFEPSIEESSEMPRLPGGRRRQAPSRQQQRQDTEKGTDEAMDTEQVDREPVQADTDNGDVQSGTATCTETTSSAAASEETSESSLSRDQVPAACMPCEPMAMDSKLERIIMLSRLKRDLWKGNYHGLILCTSYRPWPLVEKLIGFVGPSRPVVIYSRYMEPLMECFDNMIASSTFNAVRIIEPWMREHQVLPDRSHPLMRMVSSGGYLLVATTVMTKTVAKSQLPHYKVRAHQEHSVMEGENVVQEALRILREKGLQVGGNQTAHGSCGAASAVDTTVQEMDTAPGQSLDRETLSHIPAAAAGAEAAAAAVTVATAPGPVSGSEQQNAGEMRISTAQTGTTLSGSCAASAAGPPASRTVARGSPASDAHEGNTDPPCSETAVTVSGPPAAGISFAGNCAVPALSQVECGVVTGSEPGGVSENMSGVRCSEKSQAVAAAADDMHTEAELSDLPAEDECEMAIDVLSVSSEDSPAYACLWGDESGSETEADSNKPFTILDLEAEDGDAGATLVEAEEEAVYRSSNSSDSKNATANSSVASSTGAEVRQPDTPVSPVFARDVDSDGQGIAAVNRALRRRITIRSPTPEEPNTRSRTGPKLESEPSDALTCPAVAVSTQSARVTSVEPCSAASTRAQPPPTTPDQDGSAGDGPTAVAGVHAASEGRQLSASSASAAEAAAANRSAVTVSGDGALSKTLPTQCGPAAALVSKPTADTPSASSTPQEQSASSSTTERRPQQLVQNDIKHACKTEILLKKQVTLLSTFIRNTQNKEMQKRVQCDLKEAQNKLAICSKELVKLRAELHSVLTYHRMKRINLRDSQPAMPPKVAPNPQQHPHNPKRVSKHQKRLAVRAERQARKRAAKSATQGTEQHSAGGAAPGLGMPAGGAAASTAGSAATAARVASHDTAATAAAAAAEVNYDPMSVFCKRVHSQSASRSGDEAVGGQPHPDEAVGGQPHPDEAVGGQPHPEPQQQAHIQHSWGNPSHSQPMQQFENQVVRQQQQQQRTPVVHAQQSPGHQRQEHPWQQQQQQPTHPWHKQAQQQQHPWHEQPLPGVALKSNNASVHSHQQQHQQQQHQQQENKSTGQQQHHFSSAGLRHKSVSTPAASMTTYPSHASYLSSETGSRGSLYIAGNTAAAVGQAPASTAVQQSRCSAGPGTGTSSSRTSSSSSSNPYRATSLSTPHPPPLAANSVQLSLSIDATSPLASIFQAACSNASAAYNSNQAPPRTPSPLDIGHVQYGHPQVSPTGQRHTSTSSSAGPNTRSRSRASGSQTGHSSRARSPMSRGPLEHVSPSHRRQLSDLRARSHPQPAHAGRGSKTSSNSWSTS